MMSLADHGPSIGGNSTTGALRVIGFDLAILVEVRPGLGEASAFTGHDGEEFQRY